MSDLADKIGELVTFTNEFMELCVRRDVVREIAEIEILRARLDEANDWLIVLESSSGQRTRCMKEGKQRVDNLKRELAAAERQMKRGSAC